MAGRRILVTGGAGFVGSALARRLAAGGHEVRVLDDCSRGHPERLAGAPVEVVHGDVRDERVVRDALSGCGMVAHLAYLQGTATFYSSPMQILDVAVRGMTSVLAACQQTGCADLLLVSSSEVYQNAAVFPAREDAPLSVPDVLNPRYSYGGGKIISELMGFAWAQAGILDRVIVARPHNVYGPDGGREHVIPEFCLRLNRLVREYPDGVIPFPIQGTGAETRSFCYISDVADQLAVLVERGDTGVWHVGRMDERTIAATAEAAAACYGREIKIVPGTLRKGSPVRRVPDTGKITALMGYRPRVPFAEGLARTVDWYREHP